MGPSAPHVHVSTCNRLLSSMKCSDGIESLSNAMGFIPMPSDCDCGRTIDKIDS